MAVTRPSTPPPPRKVALRDIVALLAHTLGQEKSTAVVEAAAAQVGLKGPLLEPAQAEALLDELGKAAGVVGIAARAAQRQTGRRETLPPPSGSHGRPASVRAELVGLLAPSLGSEKAEETVATACKSLGCGALINERQAAEILEQLASTPGSVGATARFAKARFLLRK